MHVRNVATKELAGKGSRAMFRIMNTVHDRLRYFRETVKGLSLREFRDRVNERLEPGGSLSLGTVSNYERGRENGSRPGPRAEFLVALKEAFPDVRLEWLLLGEGPPTVLGEELSAPEGLEAVAQREGGFAARVLARYPDLELLSPEASALFMAALTRLAMGEPEMALDEDHLLELAGDLRWLLLAPLGWWGFRHAPAYEEFSDYCVACLHALTQLMPGPGEGDPVRAYPGSPGPGLRESMPVGF